MNPDKIYTARRSNDQWTYTKVSPHSMDLAELKRQIRWRYAELAWLLLGFAVYLCVGVAALKGHTASRGILGGLFALHVFNLVDRALMAKVTPPAPEP